MFRCETTNISNDKKRNVLLNNYCNIFSKMFPESCHILTKGVSFPCSNTLVLDALDFFRKQI